MNRQARIIIGALTAAAAGLAIALAVVLATDDDDDGRTTMRPGANDAFRGMMMSMAAGDSDAMLSYMRDALGDDAYQRMLEHFQDHRAGGSMMGNPSADTMMHTMMDGMMQHMPADRGNLMPPGRDDHHETPPAGSTATP